MFLFEQVDEANVADIVEQDRQGLLMVDIELNIDGLSR